MVFQVWPRVKAANPHLSSVCELGAIVGSMWRDLNPTDKQCYNDQFTREKVGINLLQHDTAFLCLCTDTIKAGQSTKGEKVVNNCAEFLHKI